MVVNGGVGSGGGCQPAAVAVVVVASRQRWQWWPAGSGPRLVYIFSFYMFCLTCDSILAHDKGRSTSSPLRRAASCFCLLKQKGFCVRHQGHTTHDRQCGNLVDLNLIACKCATSEAMISLCAIF
jgi:hypothetical protein